MWVWGVRFWACSGEARAVFSAAYLLHHASRLPAYLEQEKTTIGCSTCMPATHGTPATRTGKKTWRFQNSPVQLYHPRAARVVVFAGPALCASTVVLPVGLCPGSRGLTLRSDIRAAGFVGAGPALACPRRRRSPACGKRCMANKGIVRADVTLYI